MKLLFTGASGFLGNGIRSLLDRMYTVATVGLLSQNDYTVNIANEIPELHERYDIILHAAGKAHSVPRSEAEKQMFFDVNLQGTKNLCAALEKVGVPRVFIFISTVAVYGCAYGENITEDHPCRSQPSGKSGGYDLWYPQWEIPQYCWQSGTKECIDGAGYCKISSSVGRKGRHLQCM